MDVCSTVGEFDYEGRTLYCVEAEGELHNVLRVEGGHNTCRHTDENSCPAGFDIWVPRSYEHLEAVYDLARDWWPHEDWRAYEMMTPVGVYREENGCGSCGDYAMNSDAMADYDGVGWRSVAGDPWFLRSTGGVDDHGGYEAGCWVGTHHHWDQGLASYASGCNNCQSSYLCSTNVAKAAPSPAPTTAVPTISVAPTMDVCSSVGEFEYENRTLYCVEAEGEILSLIHISEPTRPY